MTKLVVLIVFLLALAGCAPQAGEAADDGAADAGTSTEAQEDAGAGLVVVAAVYPLAWLAEQVAPGAEVTLLNAGGGDAHDLDITPRQRATIETADVVLYMGDLDYQPQVEEAVTAAAGEVVDVAQVAGPDRLLEGSGDPHGHEDEGDDHGDEGDDHAGEDDDHADEDATDPHIWFDTEVMADVATRTGEAFAARDADQADSYEANAAAVADQMADLGTEIDDLLGGSCEFDEVIVSHVAYAYLTEPRDKQLHGITGINPEAGASGGQLGELVAEIREEGFTHVVAEPVEGRADAEALAREADVELLEIQPLDAVADEDAVTGFPELVLAQARTLATAYGCQ